MELQRRLAWIAVLAFLAACGSETTGPGEAPRPRLLVEGTGGTGPVRLDFDHAFVAQTVEATLVVQNAGDAALVLEVPALAGPFALDPATTVKVAPGHRVPLRATFTPAQAGAAEASATIATNAGDVELLLRGEGVAPAVRCTPGALDFGALLRGGRATLEVACTNESALADELVLSRIQGEGRSHFAFAFASDAGRLPIEAGETLRLPITFTAGTPGEQAASFSIESAAGVAALPVQLRARSLDGWLESDQLGCADGYVELGPAGVGAEVSTAAVLRNLGDEPLGVSGLQVEAPFAVEPRGNLEFAPGESKELRFTFRPAIEGWHEAKITLRPGDGVSEPVELCLRGKGVPPAFDCSPSPVALGARPVDIPGRERIACTVAERAPEAGPLVLGSIATTAPDFAASLVGEKTELQAGETFAVDVVWTPSAVGAAAAEIVLRTEDPASPRVLVGASGTALARAPCSYEVERPDFDFGALRVGEFLVLRGGVRALGDSECWLGDVRIEGGAGAFSTTLSDASPGAFGGANPRARFEVAFTPDEVGDSQAHLRFSVSDPAAPEVAIPLRGRAGEPCLDVSSRHLVFASAGEGCRSASSTIVVQNACEAEVTIESLAVEGDPAFPIDAPELPLLLGGGAATIVELALLSDAAGVHAGELRIAGEGETRVVSLAGEVLSSPATWDRFAITGQDGYVLGGFPVDADEDGDISAEELAVKVDGATLDEALWELDLATRTLRFPEPLPAGASVLEAGYEMSCLP